MMFSLAASAAVALQCLTYNDMVAVLGDNYGEQETVVGNADLGGAIATFVSSQNTWTIVIVYADLTTCVVATGTDFQMVLQ